jgi:hypothetical protein
LATTIKINLEFISAVGATTSFSDSIRHERDASEDGKSNLAGEVFAELRKCAGYADHVAQLPSIRDLLKTESSFTYEATDVGDVVHNAVTVSQQRLGRRVAQLGAARMR